MSKEFTDMRRYFETHKEDEGASPVCWDESTALKPFNSHDLVAYYHRQSPAMQGALKSFWRTLCSIPHAGRVFDEALGLIHHEQHHTFAPF